MATITSISSGKWSDPTIWDTATVPTAGDIVIISAGHSVEIDQSINIGDDITADALQIYGTLFLPYTVTADYTLTVKGNIQIYSTGEFFVAEEANPLPPTRTFEIVIDCAATDGKYATFVNDGGKFQVYGSEISVFRTTLASGSPITAGDSTLTTAVDTGWKVGDKIMVSTTRVHQNQVWETEFRTITAITGTSITVDSAFTYSHEDWAEVCNMTRNVKYHSASSAYKTYIRIDSTVQYDVDLRWLECYWIAVYAAEKEGINFGPTNGTTGKLIGLSIYDISNWALVFRGSGELNGSSSAIIEKCVCRGMLKVSQGFAYFYYAYDIQFEECSFAGGQYCFYVRYRGRNLTYRDCHIYDNYHSQWFAYERTAQTVIDNCKFWTCDEYSIRFSYNQFQIMIRNCFFKNIDLAFFRCDGLYMHETVIENCTFEGETYYGWVSWGLPGASWRFQRINESDAHKTYYPYVGRVEKDDTIFHSNAPSLKMLPESNFYNLRSQFAIACEADQTIQISLWLRKSTDYAGFTPYAVLRGEGLITEQKKEMTAAADVWEQIVFDAVTPSDRGSLTLEVFCNGTAGSIWIDDIEIS